MQSYKKRSKTRSQNPEKQRLASTTTPPNPPLQNSQSPRRPFPKAAREHANTQHFATPSKAQVPSRPFPKAAREHAKAHHFATPSEAQMPRRPFPKPRSKTRKHTALCDPLRSPIAPQTVPNSCSKTRKTHTTLRLPPKPNCPADHSQNPARKHANTQHFATRSKAQLPRRPFPKPRSPERTFKGFSGPNHKRTCFIELSLLRNARALSHIWFPFLSLSFSLSSISSFRFSCLELKFHHSLYTKLEKTLQNTIPKPRETAFG